MQQLVQCSVCRQSHISNQEERSNTTRNHNSAPKWKGHEQVFCPEDRSKQHLLVFSLKVRLLEEENNCSDNVLSRINKTCHIQQTESFIVCDCSLDEVNWTRRLVFQTMTLLQSSMDCCLRTLISTESSSWIERAHLKVWELQMPAVTCDLGKELFVHCFTCSRHNPRWGRDGAATWGWSLAVRVTGAPPSHGAMTQWATWFLRFPRRAPSLPWSRLRHVFVGPIWFRWIERYKYVYMHIILRNNWDKDRENSRFLFWVIYILDILRFK